MESLKIGEYTLTWLNGGVTHLDGGAMFGVVPKPLWTKKYPFNENNQIELRSDPILIQAGGKNILIESGLGNNKMSDKMKRNFGMNEESSIELSLERLDLKLSDIDMVLMTHMHFDHACGLTTWKEDTLVSTFENATIITSDIEWNEMRNPNIRSKNTYWKENWAGIENQVKTFSGEIEVFPGIKMTHTGGHSDGHSIVTIENNGEKVIHMADIMPTHAHQNVLWVMAYDDYPMKSIEQKQKWMDIGLNQNAWYSFYHDAIYRAIKWDEAGNILDFIKRK
ncbi:MBL fold metallo-hydrolase [Bacillus luteolus]|uniref:MBL fold metallo-hydrolase n=1 Tax=Litchfieldia luteola TaxID=682179 RepID=A0ABR9QIJ7_9BACI|nr:MBL fold metallo-hydrolase [Cytobacillus luteolus]MBE4908315.1 MBL fold metallo-hydrolase [Cytobacillus luteolus]MBP1943101.1 glyoxylase-like metal-dependent hydrolase (beta-lactamase superfamily II) [Cytobacillus luteolus]